MKDFLLPLISARIVYLEVLLNFRKSGKEDSRNFRLGTRSGLICVDIIQGSEAFCLSRYRVFKTYILELVCC